MLRRIVRLFVVLPAVVVLAAIGVANSQWVRLSLDPFRPDDPALSLELPLYAWLLGALILGVVVGGLATWMTQARWRRSARRGAAEADRWKAEADRLGREQQHEASRKLASAGHRASSATAPGFRCPGFRCPGFRGQARDRLALL